MLLLDAGDLTEDVFCPGIIAAAKVAPRPASSKSSSTGLIVGIVGMRLV